VLLQDFTESAEDIARQGLKVALKEAIGSQVLVVYALNKVVFKREDIVFVKFLLTLGIQIVFVVNSSSPLKSF